MNEENSMLERLKGQIRKELQNQNRIEEEELNACIQRNIEEEATGHYLPLRKRLELRTRLYDAFRRLDILQELVDDPQVTEIMVNGKDHIFVEKKGAISRWEHGFEREEQLEDMIQQIVSRINRTVNVSHPIADARLENGARVHVVLPPVALDGPVVTIRKFPEPITAEKLIAMNSLTKEAAGFLEMLVKSGYNLFISGGTGSGKTTFLNAMSGFIPAAERIITIEDSAELQIRQIPNLVRLETRNANAEGDGAIEISDLIRASLRMRPDRIVVGEVRGKECLDMLQALNTGHAGSLSTGHGNSPRDMLSRLETMALMGADLPLPAVRSQIASAIDILVHLGRLRDRTRKVLEIVEVGNYEEGEIRLNPLFRFEEEPGGTRNVCGRLKKVGTLQAVGKLKAAGYQL
ncbi:CpaF family protein [Clostridiaceae bacterium]|nr:CpaF family protein [Clostridiaceae bacterium]RKI16150.1 CpaF family protein [bacterium 1XD21-70]